MDDDMLTAGLADSEPEVGSDELEPLDDEEGQEDSDSDKEENSKYSHDAEPSIAMYLQEIRQFKLLNSGESAIGKEIEEGQTKIKSVIADMPYYSALKSNPEVQKLQQMAEEERESPDDICEESKDVSFVICLDSLHEAMELMARNAKQLADDTGGNGSRTMILEQDDELRLRIVEKFQESISDLEKKWQKIIKADAKVSHAKAQLIVSNLRLVVFYAKRYVNRGLSLGDLIQEGNIGLMRAADKFIPSRGYKFSTYASWWIKQAVERGLSGQSRTIRLPVHQCEMLGALYRSEKKLRKETTVSPTPAMIAEDMGITIEKVEQLFRMREVPGSLSYQIGESNEDTLADILPDHNPRPDQIAERTDMNEFVYSVLGKMPENERIIIVSRFGLDGQDAMTLEEVGKKIGVTRERVRQLETRALGRLRIIFLNNGLTLRTK